MNPLLYRASVAALPLLLALPGLGQAQTPQPPTPAEAQAALNPTPQPVQYTRAQLDQMLAPIALYPDQLLTQVLMAATFPDQLVEAQKWLQDADNAALKGDDLANALQPLPWDPSVKSLVAFPQLIAMLNDHLDWTEALGTAFASQQVEVFARVQFLRDRAKQAGTLRTTSQIAVREVDSDIIIEAADPDELYVPVYNPAEVYGTWPDRDAPPVYIPPPPGFYQGALGAGIGFSVGYAIARPLWGWGHPDWRRHEVVVDPSRYQHITAAPATTQNHAAIEGGAWHRTGPVFLVPEAQRPRPVQERGEEQRQLPPGTVRSNEVPHPRGANFGQGAGPQGGAPAEPRRAEPRPGEAQPGPRPGEATRPEEHRPGEPQPGPQPAGEAQPGPRPGEVARPEEHRQGEPQPGPHPAGEAQPAPRPSEPPRPAEQHAAPPQPPQPPEQHAAPPQPHPAGPPPQAQQPHPAPQQQGRPGGPSQGGGKPPAKPGEEHKGDQQQQQR